ncbi:hypothetical protein [Amphibacillus jilinensis]|uniref:hypothetical protein n=1 Tax=Amphibacillus jilinensis TaxID=1216008 RepID=UPI0002D63365|nr:hypothetical protein [Amphibacillus jilinensis]
MLATRKFKALIILALVISLSFISFIYIKALIHEQKNEQVLSEYQSLVNKYKLDIMYNRLNDPIDVDLRSTQYTYDLLSRWKAISIYAPEFIYPHQEIKENNWFKVDEVLENNSEHMQAIVDQMYEESTIPPDEARASSGAISHYILYNSYESQYFSEILVDLDIE